MNDISEYVDELGEELVRCRLSCRGIDKSVPPRCFFLENPKSKRKLSCIIIGQNPGLASARERKEYEKNRTYSTIKNYAIKHFIGENPHQYYKRARRFAQELDMGKCILWTELCKCQSALEEMDGRRKRPVPLQTFRVCIKNFLEKELKKFQDTPLIALGDQAFMAVSYRFPNRFVIGIPHPTGARGMKFFNLFENGDVNGKLKTKYKTQVAEAKEGECVRIFPKT